MITLEQVRNAKIRLNEIRTQEQEYLESNNNARNVSAKKYRDLIWNLEREARIEQEKLQGLKEEEDAEFKKLYAPHYEILTEFNKIMTFMKLYKEGKIANFKEYKEKFRVYCYEYPINASGEQIYSNGKVQINYIPIDIIKDNEYIKLCAYCVENEKPINKFSLQLIGCTPFDLTDFRSYGCSAHHENATIVIEIKCFRTEKELKEYYYKNKTKLLILKEILKKVDTKIKEYEIFKLLFDTKEWEIAYWREEKDYYKKYCYHGEEKGEYKKILEKLKELGVENAIEL